MRDEMDALVGATARVSDAEVQALPLQQAEADLMEEIMSTPVLETVPAAGPSGHPPRRWVTGRRLAAVAGIAAVATAAMFAVQTGSDGGSVWANGARKVAESVPRLVVDDPDWRISDAEQFTSDEGYMTVSDGIDDLRVEWNSAWDYGEIVDHYRNGEGNETSLTVVGHEALVFAYPDSADILAVWQQGGHVVKVAAYGLTDADGRLAHGEFEDVLATFTQVDIETWLDAMPGDVVQPDEIESAVAEMLSDIPVPEGFEPTDLADSVGVRDQYHLGADVTGAVTCSWIDHWVEGTKRGDDTAVEAAESALASSHDWSILQTMAPEGGFPDAIWEYADAIVGEGTRPNGGPVDEAIPAGTVVGDTVLEEPVVVYREELGCS
ncbi:hypothetical protein [Phytoactinopolyspora halotolerans]|uniref:Uncharacterized protein n=1 Tax=Phytoactinopolyspora halotolerans TaxID=1981512 RepID=A0A6L9SCA4_9ACTN|nr:hypothetical protein [Phytoactinopolyspora halotolerans]NEE03005.1 hypothetical protein [Phytoactinopolyspora halotolerans]